ncbi:MAG: nicotinate phosphoribosyltransferase, partial [Clostridia bacterium]|nr:nicotinate phosphoribosyltransferase [Clostridia bacterium]
MKGSFREDRQQNISMLTDYYEMTMGNGYLKYFGDKIAYFDAFFRRIPDGGGYAVMAGLESVVDYVSNLRFTGEDIDYLRGQKMFSEEFLEFLRDFKFTCDVWAIPEGTPVFP